MLVIDVKVIPASGKQECRLNKSGMLIFYVKNPAERGKANDELCTFIARILKIPRTDVVIVMGTTAPRKKIRIATSLTYEQVLTHLGIDLQTSFAK